MKDAESRRKKEMEKKENTQGLPMADDDDEDEKKKRVPDHLIRVLDGLAQEDDDLELDQAACSLTACIGKGRLVCV